MRISRLAFVGLALAALASPAAAAEVFTFDTSHTTVGFAVKHMVISTVKGRFDDFSGTVTYDPQDVTKSSVEVAIKTASIDTGNADRDKHLKSADFFDAEKYPEITFKSTRIEKRGNGYVAYGPLTMRGVTKEVELPFTITGVINDPWGNTRIGAEVEPVKVNRQEFGISWSKTLDGGGLVVSDDVTLELSVQAVKKKAE
jgi:polyisoprenoid-binding protein YceI